MTTSSRPTGRCFGRAVYALIAAILASASFGDRGEAQEPSAVRKGPDEAPHLIRVVATEPAADRGPAAGPQTGSLPAARSLPEALGRARELRGSGAAARQIVIELEPGIHRVSEPVRLTDADSGTALRPLVIRAGASGAAILRGSVPLRPIADEALRAKVGAPARPYVQIYQLPESVRAIARIDAPRRIGWLAAPKVVEIYDALGPLRPARWPNRGWAAARPARPIDAAAATLLVDAGRQRDWAGEPDLWIGGYFKWNWAYETLSATVPNGGEHVRLGGEPEFGIAKTSRAVVYNALSELDEEGEWYRDARTGRIALWPRKAGGGAEGPVEAAVADRLLAIDGAHHVRVEGIRFEMTRGDAISIDRARGISIVRCAIRWVGGRAVVIARSTDSGVADSRITGTGEGGVVLSGGDRAKLLAGRLFVDDTRIEEFSRLGLTYRPAISLDGVGNRARGNFIAGSAHQAIRFQGNDHLIELNEITRVVTDTDDSGAIYTGRDWTAQGTVIRHNFLHDLGPAPGFEVKGIYLDDLASGTRIDGNVFLRVMRPVFIGGGHDNIVSGNAFVAASPGVYLDGRGLDWYRHAVSDPASEIRTRLAAMPTGSAVWVQRYPRLAGLLEDAPGGPKRNAARGNLFFGSKDYELLAEVDARAQLIEPVPRFPADADAVAVAALIATLRSGADIRRALADRLTQDGLGRLPLSQMDRDAILPRE